MSTLYLSRARLRDNMNALGPILFPNDPAQKIAISHRLVWTLFPQELKERCFLYRESASSTGPASRSEFMVLSTREPADRLGLFDLEIREFAPKLAAGQHLQFSLRANPTAQKSEMVNGQRKSRRYDVVMQALYPLDKQARAENRPALIRSAGLDWLARQGARAGFSLPDHEAINIDGYEQFDVDPENRRAGRRQAGHSRLDLSGLLQVDDPVLFVRRLGEGFGRARAFGHGLMLVRRAPG